MDNENSMHPFEEVREQTRDNNKLLIVDNDGKVASKEWTIQNPEKVQMQRERYNQSQGIYKKYTLAKCKKIINKWLHMADTAVIDTIFAFAISQRLPGDPLWLFLIAPPGGCKTEILRAVEGTEYYHLSDLTSKTFVSGLMLGKGGDRRKIDDLLPQLDGKVLIFKDFTTVLEKNKDERREIIAQLREIYDGSFAKKFGTLDEKVEYKSTFGIIAGVTPIIDKHWKIMQQLGERFLKYRWDEDEDKTTRRAEANEGKEKQMREEIKSAVMGYLSNLEINNPELSPKFVEPLIKVSKFLALCRTPITISGGHNDFYFEYIPTPERPTRLVKQLKKFSKAVACVRGRSIVEDADILTAIKLALSTCPQDRLDTLRAIGQNQNTLHGCTTYQIAKDVKIPRTSIHNICQQLELLGLIEMTTQTTSRATGSETANYYKLTEKASALSPPTFLDASKKCVGDSAESLNSLMAFFEQHPTDNFEVFECQYGAETVKKLLREGVIFEQPQGTLRALR